MGEHTAIGIGGAAILGAAGALVPLTVRVSAGRSALVTATLAILAAFAALATLFKGNLRLE